jgi:hypothetical protein
MLMEYEAELAGHKCNAGIEVDLSREGPAKRRR